MMRRFILAALLSSFPAALMAQRQSDAAAVVRLPSAAAATPASPAQADPALVCDGSEMRSLERRRVIGGAIAAGVLAADVAVVVLNRPSSDPDEAARSIDRGHKSMTIVLGSLPIALVGYGIYQSGHPGEAFWRQALARMKIGETRSADVRACLRAPSATTSSSNAEEEWTYVTTRPYAWRYGGPVRTVKLTFKEGVLAEIRRSEVRVPLAEAWPVAESMPPVVPEVVPPELGIPPRR